MAAWARPGDPVVIGSPAWQALMARPAAHDTLPAYYAADVLDSWRRPSEGDLLRRALLLRQLRTAAGDAPTATTLGEVWQSAQAQPVTNEMLDAAHARALAQGVQAMPPALARASPVTATRQLVQAMAGDRPPPDLGSFMQRYGGCIAQGTCPQAAAAAASREAEEAARAAEAAPRTTQAARPTDNQHPARKPAKQRRSSRDNFPLIVLAYALVGLAVHLLVARAAGNVVAVLLTLAIGPAISAWVLLTQGLGEGWGAMGMLFLLLGLSVMGIPLAVIYHAIRKRFFAGL